jgi:ABC-type transport system substrate-binding protein
MDNIFEGLVEFESGTTEIKPCLATSWETSEDGKEITFHLRKGVKFHDGTDFNAAAVLFSFARQYDLNHPYHEYGQWPYWGWMYGDVEKVESRVPQTLFAFRTIENEEIRVIKIDDYTVKIIFYNDQPGYVHRQFCKSYQCGKI